MTTYKIIFAKDEILVCIETQSHIPYGKGVYFEHNKSGHLIYALVKAETEAEACEIASQKLPGYLSASSDSESGSPKADDPEPVKHVDKFNLESEKIDSILAKSTSDPVL
jgi:hypothetical protein